MAALLGSVGEFDEEKEEWRLYVERMEHYLNANEIQDESKKCAVLFSTIGPRAYKLLGCLVAPVSPGAMKYKQVVERMAQHYCPKSSVIVKRYKFHSHQRRKEEPIAAFAVELIELAQTCEFGESLNDMLRDRLVCGVNEDGIQKRLLMEQELTFEKAVRLATGWEVADKSAREMKSTKQDSTEERVKVNVLQNKMPTGMAVCYRCSSKDHSAGRCPFIRAVCFNCGRRDHMKKACRQRRHGRVKEKKRCVAEGEEVEEEAEWNSLQQIHLVNNEPIPVKVTVDGTPITQTGQNTSKPVSSEFFESIPQLQRRESLKRQPSLGDSSVANPLLVLPPEMIFLIFDLLPLSSIVHSCRRVCRSWNQLVDEPQIWQLRMQRAHNFDPRLVELTHVNWPQLYSNTVCRPNLIRSVVDGKLSLQPWFLSAKSWWEFSEDFSRTKQPEQSWSGVGGGGHGWIVEEVPEGYLATSEMPAADCVATSEMMKENEGLASCYATSFEWCCREQWVDLERAGFSREILDTLQPIIEITEWYCARGDCGSIFNLRVDLLNERMRKNESGFIFSKETAQWQGGQWHKVQHQFKDYGKGVRYVRFADGGKDTKWWAGHYGSKMAGARVRIVFNTC